MYTIKLNIGSWTAPVIGGGYVLAYPNLDGSKISKQRESENREVVRTKINGGILFYNNTNNNEFDILKTLLDSGDAFIEAKIYFNDSERISGIINLNTGFWDENKRTALLDFQSSDKYTNLLEGSDYKYNIANQNSLTAHVKFTSVLHTEVSDCYPGNIADYRNNVNPNGTANPSGVANEEWVYFTLISQPVCTGGRIFTHVTTYATFAAPGYFESEQFPGWWIKKEITPQTIDIEIPNRWVKLYTVISQMISFIDNTINISESTYCDYFTIDDTELNFLMLADKSDVKRYEATKALYEYISFADLMKNLKAMFNLDWTIEEGVFKLKRPESLSLPSFSTYPKHDFTVLNNGLSIVDNQQKYQYLQDNKFYKEVWQMEPSNDERYYNQEITYNSLIENKIDYALLQYNNDVAYLIDDPDEANDSGFVMVATEGASALDRDIINVFVNGAELINYKVATLKLIEDGQLTDRPYNKGTLNSIEYDLIKRPDKEVTYSNVPVMDINDINFGYLVKCDVGDVVPNSIEIDLTLKNFSTFKGVF